MKTRRTKLKNSAPLGPVNLPNVYFVCMPTAEWPDDVLVYNCVLDYRLTTARFRSRVLLNCWFARSAAIINSSVLVNVIRVCAFANLYLSTVFG